MNTLRERIVKHLNEKGSYCPDVDDMNIDELIDNIELSKSTLKTLKKEGVIQVYFNTQGNRMSKMNPLVGIYQMFQRNITQISTKLGISRGDRMRLKLIEQKTKDALDKLMEE